MSASLVGSEMCIRDSPRTVRRARSGEAGRTKLSQKKSISRLKQQDVYALLKMRLARIAACVRRRAR
eukprot:14775954-Alexandrium_andersonii.AAC.1